jgi:hypothetical protein
LLLAWWKLPESLRPQSQRAARSLLDLGELRRALAIPSVGAILLCMFTCVFSFAMFETTLSMLIKERPGDRSASPFHFDWRQVSLTYAFIGLTLAVVQGGVVRRLATRVSEGSMAACGAALEVAGFGLVVASIAEQSVPMLFGALAVVVSGFALLTPSLNSLLSRRSDPARQGGILGVGQSVNSLARIAGGFVGVPLLKAQTNLPFTVSAGLMAVGLLLILAAARAGRDFAAGADG